MLFTPTALLVVVVSWIPIERANDFKDALLLAARDEFLERLLDGGLLRALIAEGERLCDQFRINSDADFAPPPPA